MQMNARACPRGVAAATLHGFLPDVELEQIRPSRAVLFLPSLRARRTTVRSVRSAPASYDVTSRT